MHDTRVPDRAPYGPAPVFLRPEAVAPRQATARSVGMEWVGETEKYYDLRLQVYRLRKGEFEASTAPGPVA